MGARAFPAALFTQVNCVIHTAAVSESLQRPPVRTPVLSI